MMVAGESRTSICNSLALFTQTVNVLGLPNGVSILSSCSHSFIHLFLLSCCLGLSDGFIFVPEIRTERKGLVHIRVHARVQKCLKNGKFCWLLAKYYISFYHLNR
ncbi:hypothetical protein GOODEAATRI_015845 [Goodea atripinnis]|uniref:Uncharacterized protein n=1 Tax=Goodea atripinnis TaxID=208336 RepID=A0ABV0N1U3_9TELE